MCKKIGNYLCVKCEKKLLIEAVFGRETYDDKYYLNHYYFFNYDGLIRKLLISFKFNEKPYIYKVFYEFLNKYEKNLLNLNYYDIIIPVPISKKRMRQRGYNQSILFIKEIAKLRNIKLETNILKKVKDNKPQSILNREDRRQNVRGIYVLNKNNLKNKKILLVDDIYTTGATINECSKIIQAGNPALIDVLTIAKD